MRATARHRGGEVTAAIRKASVTEKSWTGEKLERDVTTTQGPCALTPVLHLSFEPVAPANVIP